MISFANWNFASRNFIKLRNKNITKFRFEKFCDHPSPFSCWAKSRRTVYVYLRMQVQLHTGRYLTRPLTELSYRKGLNGERAGLLILNKTGNVSHSIIGSSLFSQQLIWLGWEGGKTEPALERCCTLYTVYTVQCTQGAMSTIEKSSVERLQTNLMTFFSDILPSYHLTLPFACILVSFSVPQPITLHYRLYPCIFCSLELHIWCLYLVYLHVSSNHACIVFPHPFVLLNYVSIVMSACFVNTSKVTRAPCNLRYTWQPASMAENGP